MCFYQEARIFCYIQRNFILFLRNLSLYNYASKRSIRCRKLGMIHLLGFVSPIVQTLNFEQFLLHGAKRICLPELDSTKNTRIALSSKTEAIQSSQRSNTSSKRVKRRGETGRVGRVTSAYNSSALVFTAKNGDSTRADLAHRSVSGPFATR